MRSYHICSQECQSMKNLLVIVEIFTKTAVFQNLTQAPALMKMSAVMNTPTMMKVPAAVIPPTTMIVSTNNQIFGIMPKRMSSMTGAFWSNKQQESKFKMLAAVHQNQVTGYYSTRFKRIKT